MNQTAPISLEPGVMPAQALGKIKIAATAQRTKVVSGKTDTRNFLGRNFMIANHCSDAMASQAQIPEFVRHSLFAESSCWKYKFVLP